MGKNEIQRKEDGATVRTKLEKKTSRWPEHSMHDETDDDHERVMSRDDMQGTEITRIIDT